MENTEPPFNTSNWIINSDGLRMIIDNSSICPEYTGPFDCWELCASATGSSYIYRLTPINHESVVFSIDARAINVVGAKCKYHYNVNTPNDENWVEYNDFDGLDNMAHGSTHFINDIDGTHFMVGIKLEVTGTQSSACCMFTDIRLSANTLPTQSPISVSPTIYPTTIPTLTPTNPTANPTMNPSKSVNIISNFTITIDILNNSNITTAISEVIENLFVDQNYVLIVDTLHLNGTVLTINIIVNSVNGDITDFDENKLIISTENELNNIYGDTIVIMNGIITTYFDIISTLTLNELNNNNTDLTWIYVVIVVIIILIIIIGILIYYKRKLQKSVEFVNENKMNKRVGSLSAEKTPNIDDNTDNADIGGYDVNKQKSLIIMGDDETGMDINGENDGDLEDEDSEKLYNGDDGNNMEILMNGNTLGNNDENDGDSEHLYSDNDGEDINDTAGNDIDNDIYDKANETNGDNDTNDNDLYDNPKGPTKGTTTGGKYGNDI